MPGPGIRAFAICDHCCGVHAAGTPCPTCNGLAGAGDDFPRAMAAGRRRAPGYLLGLGIGLAAAAIIVVLGT